MSESNKDLEPQDDTVGHKHAMADAEVDETDDTEGHQLRANADAEADETDDTEGHIHTA